MKKSHGHRPLKHELAKTISKYSNQHTQKQHVPPLPTCTHLVLNKFSSMPRNNDDSNECMADLKQIYRELINQKEIFENSWNSLQQSVEFYYRNICQLLIAQKTEIFEELKQRYSESQKVFIDFSHQLNQIKENYKSNRFMLSSKQWKEIMINVKMIEIPTIEYLHFTEQQIIDNYLARVKPCVLWNGSSIGHTTDQSHNQVVNTTQTNQNSNILPPVSPSDMQLKSSWQTSNHDARQVPSQTAPKTNSLECNEDFTWNFDETQKYSKKKHEALDDIIMQETESRENSIMYPEITQEVISVE